VYLCGVVVFSKGQTVTRPYRFLARHGGYMWLETSASVVTKSTVEEPQIVVCINHTIGFSISLLLSCLHYFFLYAEYKSFIVADSK